MKKEIGETFALFCLYLVIFVAIVAIPMMILNFMGYHEIVEIFEYILGGGVAIITLWLIIDFSFRALKGVIEDPSGLMQEAKEYILNSLKLLFVIAIFLGWFWLCLSMNQPWGMIAFGIPFVIVAYIYGRSSIKQKRKTKNDEGKIIK